MSTHPMTEILEDALQRMRDRGITESNTSTREFAAGLAAYLGDGLEYSVAGPDGSVTNFENREHAAKALEESDPDEYQTFVRWASQWLRDPV